jgi:hypothetical protein
LIAVLRAEVRLAGGPRGCRNGRFLQSWLGSLGPR